MNNKKLKNRKFLAVLMSVIMMLSICHTTFMPAMAADSGTAANDDLIPESLDLVSGPEVPVGDGIDAVEEPIQPEPEVPAEEGSDTGSVPTWDYKVDLYWDTVNETERDHIERTTTSNDTLHAAYQLEIDTQKPYPINGLKIEIPRELFDSRSGEFGTVEQSVGIGDASDPSQNMPFTYRIDDKGTADTTDDTIVFYNHQPLQAGDRNQISVEYEIAPIEVVDCSTGVLRGQVTAQYEGQEAAVHSETNAITYRLDTGETSQFDRDIPPTEVSTWDDRLSNIMAEADFDAEHYVYIVYSVGVTTTVNQPTNMIFQSTPGQDGQLLGISRSTIPGIATDRTMNFDFDEGNGTATASRRVPIQNCLAAGMNAHIAKPIDIDKIKTKIKMAIAS